MNVCTICHLKRTASCHTTRAATAQKNESILKFQNKITPQTHTNARIHNIHDARAKDRTNTTCQIFSFQIKSIRT